MDAQPLYDLGPIAQIMLLGLVIALGPLAWLWMRNKSAAPARRLRALTLMTLFLTFDLVLFGAFTRLTDSGLGCPDWPGCYGSASPQGAKAQIAQAQAILPDGPVTHRKAWIEMIHRYLATAVGVLILAMTLTAWMARSPQRGGMPISPWWPTLTLVWVIVQGAFGALTVTMKLFPAIVTLHLLGGLALLALLCVQVVRFSQLEPGKSAIEVPRGVRRVLVLASAAVGLQIALGGWVSTNYAVLACSDFPMCQGQWWPTMDFQQGFSIWRELGKTPEGEYVSFAALTAIHYTHRLFAGVVAALLVGLAWLLYRHAGTRVQAMWIAGLLLLQVATGLSTVVFDWPLLVAVLHTGGAAGLVMVLTWTLVSTIAPVTAVTNSRLRGTRLPT